MVEVETNGLIGEGEVLRAMEGIPSDDLENLKVVITEDNPREPVGPEPDVGCAYYCPPLFGRPAEITVNLRRLRSEGDSLRAVLVHEVGHHRSWRRYHRY